MLEDLKGNCVNDAFSQLANKLKENASTDVSQLALKLTDTFLQGGAFQ